jgi:DNA-directed RNA polymerase specialized sigma24 family protein
VEIEGLELAAATPPDTLLVVNEALERLAAEDAPKAELVRLRFFIGLTNAEAAKVLGLSEPTVKRYWDFSRAWLMREIRGSPRVAEPHPFNSTTNNPFQKVRPV